MAAPEPDPPQPADARLKRRRLHAIAAEATPCHPTVQPDDAATPWQDFGPGLRIKVLHQAEGLMSYLVRLAAGSSLPPHRHPVDEECVVLEGEVRIGTLRVAGGGYQPGPARLAARPAVQ